MDHEIKILNPCLGIHTDLFLHSLAYLNSANLVPHLPELQKKVLSVLFTIQSLNLVECPARVGKQ